MSHAAALAQQQLSALSVVHPANTAAVLHNAAKHSLRLESPAAIPLSVHYNFSVHPATVQSKHWPEGWFNNYE